MLLKVWMFSVIQQRIYKVKYKRTVRQKITFVALLQQNIQCTVLHLMKQCFSKRISDFHVFVPFLSFFCDELEMYKIVTDVFV